MIFSELISNVARDNIEQIYIDWVNEKENNMMNFGEQEAVRKFLIYLKGRM